MESLAASSKRLPYQLLLPSGAKIAVPADFDEFQSEYIRLFQVAGRHGPPCPLHAGHYGQDRLRALEKLVRFYNFFGLQTGPGMMPDHVTVQLEFMGFLAGRDDEDDLSALRAQRDFLETQLLNWWQKLTARLKKQQPHVFYLALAELTQQFLETDATYLNARIRNS